MIPRGMLKRISMWKNKIKKIFNLRLFFLAFGVNINDVEYLKLTRMETRNDWNHKK